MKKFLEFIKENITANVYVAAILNQGATGSDHLSTITEDSAIFVDRDDAEEHIIDFFEDMFVTEFDSLEEIDTYISENNADGYYYQLIKLEYNK